LPLRRSPWEAGKAGRKGKKKIMPGVIKTPAQTAIRPSAASKAEAARQAFLSAAGERLQAHGPSVYARATAEWSPKPGSASPFVPLFQLPVTTLGKIAQHFSKDRGLKLELSHLLKNDHSFKVGDLAAVMQPLQQALAEKGWSSWVVLHAPTVAHVSFDGGESMRHETIKEDGVVGIRIAAAGDLPIGAFGAIEPADGQPAGFSGGKVRIVSAVEGIPNPG
jgi:hypothetical protein